MVFEKGNEGSKAFSRLHCREMVFENGIEKKA